MDFRAISVREIESYVNRPNTRLLDIRTREEYAQYHLEGADNIPYEELEKYKGRLSHNVIYILYCEWGGSSLRATKELSEEGYHVYTVIGGMKAWEESRQNQ